MPELFILCPTTKRPIDIGWCASWEGFQNDTPQSQEVECPHCDRRHRWKKADVHLDEDGELRLRYAPIIYDQYEQQFILRSFSEALEWIENEQIRWQDAQAGLSTHARNLYTLINYILSEFEAIGSTVHRAKASGYPAHLDEVRERISSPLAVAFQALIPYGGPRGDSDRFVEDIAFNTLRSSLGDDRLGATGVKFLLDALPQEKRNLFTDASDIRASNAERSPPWIPSIVHAPIETRWVNNRLELATTAAESVASDGILDQARLALLSQSRELLRKVDSTNVDKRIAKKIERCVELFELPISTIKEQVFLLGSRVLSLTIFVQRDIDAMGHDFCVRFSCFDS